MSLVAKYTFADGFTDLRAILDDPDVVHALRLTVWVAIVSVVLNTVFGVGISLLLVRYEFPGKRWLSAFLDLPLAVSPIVVGLALVLVYGGRNGWFGPTLEDAGLQVIFATPGIVLATVFVALPLVIREVVPVLEEIGFEQEQAAQSLGANAIQVFRRITLPVDQMGGRLRRRPQPGPVPRRVRCGQGGLGQPPRPDPDRHARRRGEVPELRPRAGPTPPPSCWPSSPWPAS